MSRKQKKMRNRILLSAGLLVVAFLLEKTVLAGAPLWALLLIYLPAYFVAGYDVLWRAARNIAHGQVFDENFLMCVATVGALVVGFLPSGDAEFAEASFVMIFYQTGELFQSVAVGKSRKSISALMNIRPDVAIVVRDGEESEVSPESVAVGETILLRPGDRIPLDGEVLTGTSDLDTVALTGESAPRAVAPGDKVISGCTNLSGVLTVRVSSVYGESTVARVLELVENSAAKKSKSEQFITRFARYYTPAVVIAAVLLAFLPPIFSGDFAGNFTLWLTRALTFLVVSCPCALVISVPLAFFGGIGGASRFGVLIKGSKDLEALARTEICAFDKTGTLTRGNFEVAGVYPGSKHSTSGGISEEELLLLGASAEAHSTHPVGKALLNAAAKKGLELLPVGEVREVAGRGVVATIGGDEIAVGNDKLMHECGIAEVLTDVPVGTVIHIAKNGTYMGAILISDTLKPGAAEAIRGLQEAGVRRTVMLTGDREAVAAAVAKELGLTEYHAELLPADKVNEVEALLNAPRRGGVAFVGDGINDAPVLSRADVGIAMGALGSDAAIEAADVVLMDDDPRKISRAIRQARKTIGIVRQNIVLALAIKAIVLVCSAFGWLGALQMPLAVFADVGVAVLAILNSMRALRA